MKQEDYINFDKKKLEKLETAYNNAVKQDKFQFDFDNKVLITDYAKYLIEHLKNTLKL